jgi:putative transposase
MAQLMIEVLREGMRKRKFSIHAFVIMPDHLHVLLTPDHLLSMERAVQLIKGGFSFRVKKELGLAMEIWQPSFSNHRVRNEGDFSSHSNTSSAIQNAPDWAQITLTCTQSPGLKPSQSDSLG